ncbi:MAG: NADP-dependent malic enzyme [Candidatus Pacebacteria bacterium]|nr:NADP-dependent malic enzyme [Candidatus Paceibacterota bacterium]
MKDIYQQALTYHQQHIGKLTTTSAVGTLTSKQDLSLAYTPGVAEPCRVISKNKDQAYNYTLKGRTVAVISDGSAVLGLGNIGAEAALPVMEGKALLIKQFGGVDAFPLVINAQDPREIIKFVKQVAPTFAGINLEDIAAPTCFQVEEALQDIGIPVFHDDQHGTAIVVRAALLNAAKVVNKPFDSLRVGIIGAGSAGLAIARMILGLSCSADSCSTISHAKRVRDVILFDRQGALVVGRAGQNIYKQAIAGLSNKEQRTGLPEQALIDFDVVIGVSGPGSISPEVIKVMADKPIVCALANPTPEIMPEDAKKAGAYVIATGRSDFANQINNVLAFPGIFRAVVKGRLKTITYEMKEAASDTIAQAVTQPTREEIIPSVFTPNLAEKVAEAVIKASK